MKSQMSTRQGVIERLQRLPLEEVPADLTERVMARVFRREASKIMGLWNGILQPTPISFRPIYACVIILLFCGAFFLGRSVQHISSQVATPANPDSQVQPGALDNPESAYLVGRGLLRDNKSKAQALAFLQRASLLDPQNPEFAYWEGVGYWVNGDKKKERLSYLRGLETDPENVPLLINLGHTYLSEKNYQKALDAYTAVRTVSPEEPVALYNSGLIYRALGMIPEEIASWRSFLQSNRIGTKSFRAVQRLNGYGVYSFRTYQVGRRQVIVNQQALLDESLPEDVRSKELTVISAILENNALLHLEVVAFVENDREAARKRAAEIKSMIVKNSKADVRDRVKLSWFDAPETITNHVGASGFELPEGLLMFTRQLNEREKEVSI